MLIVNNYSDHFTFNDSTLLQTFDTLASIGSLANNCFYLGTGFWVSGSPTVIGYHIFREQWLFDYSRHVQDCTCIDSAQKRCRSDHILYIIQVWFLASATLRSEDLGDLGQVAGQQYQQVNRAGRHVVRSWVQLWWAQGSKRASASVQWQQNRTSQVTRTWQPLRKTLIPVQKIQRSLRCSTFVGGKIQFLHLPIPIFSLVHIQLIWSFGYWWPAFTL